MNNDKICPICGCLMIYRFKHLKQMKFYLCLLCGHIEVMECNYGKK